ncbi:uncharacterized protein H6S33_013160 [Morchella sextelata]|uniref:uncharacterized protein n=1 Tax=Morchella sextelata TaxID=1174677 RepID=UPI001D03E842|nr:uncharacterized protein H6S33_013160 [Morchella sextelata]KAH0609674.1 hypothetical protein H6S33_013160 [Morchella sextelata]
MRFTLNSLLFLASLTLALPLDETPTTIDHIPTVKEAAVQARKLLKSESIATLSTVFPEDEPHGLAGQPIGLMDYYADCSTTGNPTLLAMGIATSFKNAKDGAPISLSIRSHASSWSQASQPRLSLIGRLSEKVPRGSEEADRLKACFTSVHKDARIWAPGNKIHESDWVTFEVETVYWIGGFGNVAYIGYIPVEMWESVTLQEIEELEREEDPLKGVGLKVQSGLSSLRGLFKKD